MGPTGEGSSEYCVPSGRVTTLLETPSAEDCGTEISGKGVLKTEGPGTGGAVARWIIAESQELSRGFPEDSGADSTTGVFAEKTEFSFAIS